MVGEKELPCQTARWTILRLLVLASALFCVPAHARETPMSDKAEPRGETDADTIDPELHKIAEAAQKRLSTWSDEVTLTLKDGETGQVKLKENVTPVREILVTPHIEDGGTKIDVAGMDAEGRSVAWATWNSKVIPDHRSQTWIRSLSIAGRRVLFRLYVNPSVQPDGRVAADVKVLSTQPATGEEQRAMLLVRDKRSHVERLRVARAAHQRLNTYTDMGSFRLQDGEIGRMRIKKNLTAVAEILITPRFQSDRTKFEVRGVDVAEKPVEGVQAATDAMSAWGTSGKSKDLPMVANGRKMRFKLLLTNRPRDGNRAVVEVKVLFTPKPTAEELSAIQLMVTLPKGLTTEDGSVRVRYGQSAADFFQEMRNATKPIREHVPGD